MEAVERRKVEKEKEKWEKGKFALQNITASVDTQILEQGLIGGMINTSLFCVVKSYLWLARLLNCHNYCCSQVIC